MKSSYPPAAIAEKSKKLPSSPGCYLMKNSEGKILYVGKAKNLKKRVRSYFLKGFKGIKTEHLLEKVADFSFILTETEADAYVLENNLIKLHSPHYNIKMRDDKSYPYILIDYSTPFPRPEIVRRPKKKKEDILIGPFPDGANLREILSLLMKLFQLRDCSLVEFKRRANPCILYQMNFCSGSCVGKIDQANYLGDVKKVENFFKGKNQKIFQELTRKMEDEAERENFEYALIIRDELEKLKKFAQLDKQKNVEFHQEEMSSLDLWAYYQQQEFVNIVVFNVRNGILIGNSSFEYLNSDLVEDIKTEFISFISRYYQNHQDILPSKIISNFKEEEVSLLKDILGVDVKNKKMANSLWQMAFQQAKENSRVQQASSLIWGKSLEHLKNLVGLEEIPQKIECYDVAIWQGRSPTASQILFEKGELNKKGYRHYKLQERPEGNNDFAMIREVLERRLKKAPLPDLIVVDGGKGQVSSALLAIKESGHSIPVVGIAKSKIKRGKSFSDTDIIKSEERLIIPNRKNDFILKKDPQLLRLITLLRDEAHRFSRKLHHKHEEERFFSTFFDSIEGIGIKTKNKILSHLKITREELLEKNIPQIQKELGVSKRVATILFKNFQSLKKNSATNEPET